MVIHVIFQAAMLFSLLCPALWANESNNRFPTWQTQQALVKNVGSTRDGHAATGAQALGSAEKLCGLDFNCTGHPSLDGRQIEFV